MLLDRATEVTWTHSSRGTKLPVSETDLQAPNSRLNGDNAEDVAPSKGCIVLIDKRVLVRECLAHAIRSATGQDVNSFPSVEFWLKAPDNDLVSLVVIYAGSSPRDVEACREALLLVSQSSHRIPSILLSDSENPDRIVEALEQGARGYIPTSVAFDVAIKAMRLVRAGGIFVPASSLTVKHSSDGSTANQIGDIKLTPRQVAVVEALRRGKANKIIAYELNMRESTVKVHVRNIMRKFKATNRTEIAFKANRMLDTDQR